jgi:hypothetical protein
MGKAVSEKQDRAYPSTVNRPYAAALKRLGTPTNHRVNPLAWQRTGLLGLVNMGLLASLLLMTEAPARAYVDPGSGLLTFQMLGASLAGVLFYVRHKLKRFLGARPSKMETVDLQSDAAELSRPEQSGVELNRNQP